MARPRGYALNRDAFDDWQLQHLGQSITQIAEAAEMQRASLSGLVGGHQRASLEMAHKLAAAMGVKVGTLFPSLGSSRAHFTADGEAAA